MKVKLMNTTGATIETKVGFSWTTFFFGLFPALFRGDIKWAAIQFMIAVLVGSITLGIGAPFVSVVFAFIYNKIFIKEMMIKGFKPASSADEVTLKQNQII